MTCTDCRAEGADCLTRDRERVCADCLYERVVRERDEAEADLVAHKEERVRLQVETQRAKAKAAGIAAAVEAVVTGRAGHFVLSTEASNKLLAALDDAAPILAAHVDAAVAGWGEARTRGFTEGHAAGRQAAFDGEVTHADLQRAYQRGAEAMREAAAEHVEWFEWRDTERAKIYVNQIRALPVPEDK
jgi:hypothetical protein